MTSPFERIVVVSLRRRADRLAAFWKRLDETGWPFEIPVVFEAVDSQLVPTPSGVGGHNVWNSGGGAWGCMQSHRQILERCLIDKVSSVLVLEDDAFPVDNFIPQVTKFLQEVPDDWEGLMLGGQHFGRVPVVKPGILKCQNCQRTHAYACRGKYLRDLYALWHSYFGHCDHVMGPFQAKYNVYAPDPFLIAQGVNQSDISGRLEPRRLWSGSDIKAPMLLLECPKSVLRGLWTHGVHTGYNRDRETDMDNGLRAILYGKDSYINKVRKLRWWSDVVRGEASAFENGLCAVWSEKFTEEQIQVVRKAFGPDLVELRIKQIEEFLFQRQVFAPIVPKKPCTPCEEARLAREAAKRLASKTA